MKEAHQVLSYPTPLDSASRREVDDLVEIVKEVRKIMDERKKNVKHKELVDPGFTIVGPGGVKILPEKEEENLEDRTKTLETSLEKVKIFPALYKIAMILRYGFHDENN